MVLFMLSNRPIDLVKTQASISRLIRHRAVVGPFKGIHTVRFSQCSHSVTRCSLLPPRRPLPILQPLNHNLHPFSPSPSFDLENLPKTPHLRSPSGSFHPRTRTKAQFRQANKVFLYDRGKCGTSILVHSCSVPTHPPLIPELCRWIPRVPFPKPIHTPSATQFGQLHFSSVIRDGLHRLSNNLQQLPVQFLTNQFFCSSSFWVHHPLGNLTVPQNTPAVKPPLVFSATSV